MSSEVFKSFMAKVQKDADLQKELRAAGSAAGMPVEAMVAFAAAKGYEFKVEDVSNELTDAALENVAGGGAQPHMVGYLKIEDHKIGGLSSFLSEAGNLMIKL